MPEKQKIISEFLKYQKQNVIVLNIENKVLGLVETVIYNGYKFVLCEKYSLISYEKSNDNQWELTDIVNYNSNLYTDVTTLTNSVVVGQGLSDSAYPENDTAATIKYSGYKA